MSQKFTSFVLLAEMRTGSNFLEANLNAMPGVACYGEIFNPHFIGKLNQEELFGVTLPAREKDPSALLTAIRDNTSGLAGFRYFHDHDPRVLSRVMDDPACAKIILTRNPLESYVSWKIARATGQWKLTNAKKLKTAKIPFDGAEFEAHVTKLQAFQVQLMHGLQTSGQTAFYIDYDDLNDTDVLNGLARFLGITARLETPDGSLKKQNPAPISEKVENPEAISLALARLDRFNLSRTPNFEPRRNAAVPSFLVAGRACYMPVRGGPETAVQGWLAGLGEVTDNLNQKTLRQWMRAGPAHRSFTVLRHPLARAHHGFCTMILPAKLPQIHTALIKSYKLALPEPGTPLDHADHRNLFLGFLHFLKLNVSGQSGMRVAPQFATQTATLQGFAQFQGPDLVLREDRLETGLAFLAAELGVACPALSNVQDPSADLLAGIYDAELEDAAQEAYSRDYLGYGFGPWR